jgi:hypothetical protein
MACYLQILVRCVGLKSTATFVQRFARSRVTVRARDLIPPTVYRELIYVDLDAACFQSPRPRSR